MAKMSPKRRRDAVLRAIRSDGWSWQVAADLAVETGWSQRTIYRDRDACLDELAQAETEHLPRRRAEFLADARRLREQAAQAGKFTAAARLLQMSAQVQGLDRPPAPELPDLLEAEQDGLAGLLLIARRNRRQAQAEGSWTAVTALLRQEAELVQAVAAETRRARAEELAELPQGDVLAAIAEAIRALPAEEREALRSYFE